ADVTGAIVARMDDRNGGYRGWDLWLENERVAAHIVNKWPDDAIKVATEAQIKPDEWTHLFVTYDGSSRPEGLKIYINGKPQATNIQAKRLKNTIKTKVPLTVGQRHTTAQLEASLIHDLRLYGRALSAEEVARLVSGSLGLWLTTKTADQRAASEVSALFELWIGTVDAPTRELRTRVEALDKEAAAIKVRGTVAHVMSERAEEPMAYILFRGEYDKRRDAVKAATPAVLPTMPADLPRNRLGFAQWLVRPEHPLAARVTVNRFWQEVFGTGLVRTTGDFGVSGELPSHPELLDWMAVELRESGWDMKTFFKMLVTSATYRQAAVATSDKLEKDAQNRLMSRGPRFRMDAEVVRDYALAASGLLSSKIGGPSVKPYQPDGVWEAVAMPESNTRNYRRDSGESLYRRSLYTFWKRAAPPAEMDIFNAPNRETCSVRRERTNTPLQALVTLNSTQYVEAARHLAQLALKEGGETADGRLELIARRVLARPLRAEEITVLNGSLKELTSYYQSHSEDAAKLLAVGETKADSSLDAPTLAAWTMLTNELMNLDEVLNK
ncbi:MAG TPA: DUF1553 domain-containing protein, partial [Isosphaeraceae bacterium]|nr:DUF1553 domain-containing protein [Isosphaeraceae bacterium]